MKEFLKLLLAPPAYLIIAPLIGVLIARSRVWQRSLLCLMVFMTSWFPTKFTMMVESIEWYRGHTKGYECSLIECIAIALIVASVLNRRPGFKWMPPGLWLYLGYCVMSCLSIPLAMNQSFAFMAAFKFFKISILVAGVFHALRDEDDFKWFLRTIAWTLIHQTFIAWKSRYIDGYWRAQGWFEHPNPLAMWAYFCALPILGASMSSKVSRKDSILYFTAFAMAGATVILTVSRASLGAYSAGAVLVTGLIMLRGLTRRVMIIVGFGLLGAVFAGLFAMGTVMSRVQEQEEAVKNQEWDLRDAMNEQAKVMLLDSAIGVGWNNYGLANSRPNGKYSYVLEDWAASRGDSILPELFESNPLTESLYWLILAENGYPGFVSFLLFMLLVVWWAFRVQFYNWRDTEGCFASGLLVALIIVAYHGRFERILTQTKNLSMFMLMLGCLARLEYNRKKHVRLLPAPVAKKPSKPRKRRRP
jgi:hypothetical protein